MVVKMYRRNCRYSDCQFSETSTAKPDEVRYTIVAGTKT
jgi:hypothetical protein